MTGNRPHSADGLTNLGSQGLDVRPNMQRPETTSRRMLLLDLRTLLLVSAVILLSSVGNLALAYGCRFWYRSAHLLAADANDSPKLGGSILRLAAHQHWICTRSRARLCFPA